MNIVFLEGLPGVGKTTLINKIRELNLHNVYVVDEILEDFEDSSQLFFMENDIKKISKYKEGTIIIDRGAISTLSYNECLDVIGVNKDINSVVKWFDVNFKELYKNSNIKTIYLKKHNHKYLLRYKNLLDPYGSIKNQKKLEKITLKNIRKYCKNYKIFYIDNYIIEEIINEIIN